MLDVHGIADRELNARLHLCLDPHLLVIEGEHQLSFRGLAQCHDLAR